MSDEKKERPPNEVGGCFIVYGNCLGKPWGGSGWVNDWADGVQYRGSSALADATREGKRATALTGQETVPVYIGFGTLTNAEMARREAKSKARNKKKPKPA